MMRALAKMVRQRALTRLKMIRTALKKGLSALFRASAPIHHPFDTIIHILIAGSKVAQGAYLSNSGNFYESLHNNLTSCPLAHIITRTGCETGYLALTMNVSDATVCLRIDTSLFSVP